MRNVVGIGGEDRPGAIERRRAAANHQRQLAQVRVVGPAAEPGVQDVDSGALGGQGANASWAHGAVDRKDGAIWYCGEHSGVQDYLPDLLLGEEGDTD